MLQYLAVSEEVPMTCKVFAENELDLSATQHSGNEVSDKVPVNSNLFCSLLYVNYLLMFLAVSVLDSALHVFFDVPV